MYQGIQSANLGGLRVGAAHATENRNDAAIYEAFGNIFYIPLDFELLASHLPYFQGALLELYAYELTCNDDSKVIKSTNTKATYH